MFDRLFRKKLQSCYTRQIKKRVSFLGKMMSFLTNVLFFVIKLAQTCLCVTFVYATPYNPIK